MECAALCVNRPPVLEARCDISNDCRRLVGRDADLPEKRTTSRTDHSSDIETLKDAAV